MTAPALFISQGRGSNEIHVGKIFIWNTVSIEIVLSYLFFGQFEAFIAVVVDRFSQSRRAAVHIEVRVIPSASSLKLQ